MIYDDSGKAVDYSFIDANEKYIELTGVDPRGKTVLQAFPGIENDPFDWIGTFGKVASTGKNIRFEQYLQPNDRWYDVVGYQYKPDHFVAAFLEITERKRFEAEKHALEQQFQQTQKLESLGVLAGGIAHDFNNILAIIIGHCSLAAMNPDSACEHILPIEKAADRAAGLCRQMLSYAGKASFTLTQVNMAALVDEMAQMLKASISQNVVIKADLSTDVPSIKGDASQLRQIVMNLIINASEAIGEAQGVIHITLTKSAIKAGQAIKDHFGKAIPVRLVCLSGGFRHRLRHG